MLDVPYMEIILVIFFIYVNLIGVKFKVFTSAEKIVILPFLIELGKDQP